MAKNVDVFGGFDLLADVFTPSSKSPITKIDDDDTTLKLSKSVDNGDDTIPADPDDVDTDNDDNDDTDDKGDDSQAQKKQTGSKDTVDDDDKTDDDDAKDDTKADDTTDLGEVEPEISSYFAGSLIDKLGIELENKDTKFEKLDDVIDLMTNVIKANSKPTYASQEVEEYDEFVRNGGNLKEFYDQVYKDIVDPTKVDLEDVKDQKAVIEANLRLLGYKDERIKKVISRYEDADVLKDEAEDALESLKDNQSKKAKTLLAEQEKARLDAEKQNKAFVDNVTEYVNNINNILGVEVDSKTKREIIDYIFRVKPDGTTAFQKDYAANIVKSLVESAYVKKYGDILLTKTTKKATDAALNKVRDKLKASKGKRNTGSGSGLGKASPNFSSLSGLIIK